MRHSPVVNGSLVGESARGDITLTTDDRFYSVFLGPIKEFNGSEHGTVVRDGHRIHIIFGHPVKQRIKSYGAVQETVLGVNVKVYEVGHIC